MKTASGLLYLALIGAAGVVVLGGASCSKGFETGGGGASGASSSNSSAGGGVPGCSDPVDGQPVQDGCGIFVSDHGSADGDGSLAKPLRSIDAAVAPAGPLPIYACGTFDESVLIGKSLTLWGGFDCTGTSWIYHRDGRTKLTAPAGHAPLTVQKPAATIALHGFAIDGEAGSAAGSSAIAVAIDDAVTATLSDCDLSAGDAADGADATAMTTPAHVGAPGESDAGTPSAPCAMSQQTSHGGSVTCGGQITRGGDGGLGGAKSNGATAGAPGGNGTPFDGDSDGLGGAGETSSGTLCNPGGPGLPGADGKEGKGGKDTMLTLSGVLGGDGEAGVDGGRGHGGGGGGGAAGGPVCSFAGMLPGVGGDGGGGGSGGCGGAGGISPTAGGSSIALLALGDDVTFTRVSLQVGHAGRGGSGAHGQPGGSAGAGAQAAPVGGVPAHRACDGGEGGHGGRGGPSGGARGGHAIGVAFATTPASSPAATFNAGSAGKKGNGGSPLNAGADGTAASCWDFAADKACT